MRPDKRRARFGGRWPHDRPVRGGTMIDFGMHYGYRWCTIPSAMGPGVCGYVKIGRDHPWWSPEFMGEVDVHGGLTYFDHDGWVGFDTAHAGDCWPQDFGGLRRLPRRFRRMIRRIAELGPWVRYWTPALVAAECKRLAGYAAEYQALSRWREVELTSEILIKQLEHERSVSFIGSKEIDHG